MQGSRVWSQVQEDSTCHGAAKPMPQNYWARRACALQEENINTHLLQWEAHTPHLETSPSSPQQQKAWAQRQRPSLAKNKKQENHKRPQRRTSGSQKAGFLFQPVRLNSFQND